MKTRWWRNEFKVGLMTIVGLALLSALLIKSYHWRFTAGGHKIRIRFDYVGGLLKNAPVHIHGVEIGKVVLVRLVGSEVEVTARLHTKVSIKEGYQILIDILGLVGEKYIEIINGPAGNPETKDDPLRGTSPVSVGRVLMKADEITTKTLKTIDFIQDFIDRNERDLHAGAAELKALTLEAKDVLRKTMDNVDVLLTRIDRLTGAAEGDVGQTIASLRGFAERLNADRQEISSLMQGLVGDLDQLLTRTAPAIEESVGNFQNASEDLRASIGKVSQDIAGLSESASQLVAQLGEIATSSDQKLQKGLDDLGSSTAALNELADRINGLVAEVESGQGTLGKLVTDEGGYKQFNETMSAGKRAVEDVSDVTHRLSNTLQLFDVMDMSKEYELSYDRLSGSLQNQFTLSLTSSNPYFYMAGLSVRDKLAYDLQDGRRFGDLMARVGAIRSKSSIGLDYWALSRRLCTSLEVIDVTERQPTVDLDVAVRFLSSWYFIFGARDLAGSKIGLNFGIRTVFRD
jgi:ABC-type transporter Mla subunit MlaD